MTTPNAPWGTKTQSWSRSTAQFRPQGYVVPCCWPLRLYSSRPWQSFICPRLDIAAPDPCCGERSLPSPSPGATLNQMVLAAAQWICPSLMLLPPCVDFSLGSYKHSTCLICCLHSCFPKKTRASTQMWASYLEYQRLTRHYIINSLMTKIFSRTQGKLF